MAWSKVGLYHYPKRKLPWLVRWYGEINPATGKPKRYGKSFRIKRKAEDFRLEKMSEFKNGVKRDRLGKITLEVLCEDFITTWNPTARSSTIKLYRSTAERLFSYFGKGCLIRNIGPKDADGFVAAQTHHQTQHDRILADWTRVQIIKQCKTVFETAVRWELITNNPFANVKMPKPSTKRWHRLTVEEYHKLLEAAPTLRWKVFYALAYTSGARFGELFNLTWVDIDFERGQVIIQNRKGNDNIPPFQIKDNESRSIPLPKHTMDLLTLYQQEAPEGVPYILLTKERYERVIAKWEKCCKLGQPWQNGFMVNNVLRDFRAHAKRAGITFDGEFTIHTFRKSCAQNWADRLPANVVKYYLGHSSMDTTNQFYSIVDESHTAWTKKVMDEMLKSKNEGDLDTRWTLAPQNTENREVIQNRESHKPNNNQALQE